MQARNLLPKRKASKLEENIVRAISNNGETRDWDKFGATTNIVVLRYDAFDERRPRPEMGQEDNGFGRFKVINRIEIPKSDMQYDLAVRTIMDLDDKYNPFAIYADKGAGEYQIEILRKHLGEKVKGVFYGSSIEVRDPISRVSEKKPLKPFLINQTTLLLERGQLRIPHRDYDEVLHRQMTNYQVVKISGTNQTPVYSDTDEHSLDAMVFALFAFIEQKPNLINTIFQTEAARKSYAIKVQQQDPLSFISDRINNRHNVDESWDEPGSPPMKKVQVGFGKRGVQNENNLTWGRRGQSAKKRPVKRRF